MPQRAANKYVIVYGLIALGFAGLIGAHEWAAAALPPGAASSMTVPFILAAIGTLCFVAAGLLARKLMRENGAK